MEAWSGRLVVISRSFWASSFQGCRHSRCRWKRCHRPLAAALRSWVLVRFRLEAPGRRGSGVCVWVEPSWCC